MNKKTKIYVISAVAVLLVIGMVILGAMLLRDDGSGGAEGDGETKTFSTSSGNIDGSGAQSPSDPVSGTTETESKSLTYEEFMALSGSEQQEYFNTFSDVDAFFVWYNNARDEYKAKQDGSEFEGSAEISLGTLGK